MLRRCGAIVVCSLAVACSSSSGNSAAVTTSTIVAVTSTRPPAVTSSTEPRAVTTTTVPRPLFYVFPFIGKKVSYGRTHHDYPATDVFGCGATVVAPIGGTIAQTRVIDPWVPKVDAPATRGGKYVSLIGDDGVRYYFAHLDSVSVAPGDAVAAGRPLGIMGRTGNARKSACHTHVGVSWPCDHDEWAVRRGEIWPWRYLDSWRTGGQLSPVAEIAATEADHPHACDLAGFAGPAGDG